eukprot:GFUD01042856.1.p1 GENE.GFUD01042856.1~~GFUD01042856.1.p1  ORF type:complete len:229 (+),score=41.36 GFUD01042856.1:66-689(+)
MSNRSCLTTGGRPCVFPFRYHNISYSACTWRDGHKTQGVPWCSLSVNENGDHVNSQGGRGSTWDFCSGDCITSHLECSPVTPDCSNSSILQQCVESSVSTGDHVATWCVTMRDKKHGGEKTIHVKCAEDCVTYKEEGFLGLCAHSGPECLMFAMASLILLIITLVTVFVLICCVRKKKGQDQEMRIRSASIQPGDRYRKSTAGVLDG